MIAGGSMASYTLDEQLSMTTTAHNQLLGMQQMTGYQGQLQQQAYTHLGGSNSLSVQPGSLPSHHNRKLLLLE